MLRLEKVTGKNVWDLLKRGSYNLWRLMIDRDYQGKGYGRRAV